MSIQNLNLIQKLKDIGKEIYKQEKILEKIGYSWISLLKNKRTTTAGIVHRLGRATGDRNVSRKLLSFIAKTVRCNAYDTIPADR